MESTIPPILSSHAPEPFEVRACRPTRSSTEYTTLRRATTRARAKTTLSEEFPSILLELRQLGWINENETVANISFEIVDAGESNFQAKPISSHPIRQEGTPVNDHIIWFENLTGRTLNDLRRYHVTLLGRSHYQVTSPNGAYSIDLEACAGAGSCTCEDFETRRSPYREKAQKWVEGNICAIHQDCAHLKHVKFLLAKPFGEQTAIPISKLEDPGQTPNAQCRTSCVRITG